MSRTPSYTDKIELSPGAPVGKPKGAGPDLTAWITQLEQVDQQTRLAGKKDISIPFNVPADTTIKTDDGEKTFSAARTAKLRFQQAAEKMGIGVSITIEAIDPHTNRVLVSTMVRRVRKGSRDAQPTAESAQPGAEGPKAATIPVGLPRPAKR